MDMLCALCGWCASGCALCIFLGAVEGGGGLTLFFYFSHPVAKLEEYIGITVSVCPDFVLTISCKPLDVL